MSKRTKRRRHTRPASTFGQPVVEAFGDLIDPTEYLTDEPGWGGQSIASFLVSRDKGANAPAFRTDTDLANIRGAARIICDTSVNAKCALQNLQNYVVGSGFDYSVVDKGRTLGPGEDQTPLASEAGAIVEEFLTRTKYGTAHKRKRLLWSERRDGEYFTCLSHVGGGRAAVRVLDPGFFRTPQNPRQMSDAFPPADDVPDDWEFGIHTEDGDYENVFGYLAQWSDSSADYDYYTVDEVLHAKINVDDVIKRGLSDFYWVYTALLDAAKLLRNGVRGAQVQAAIAYVVEHGPGVPESSVTSFKTGSAVAQYNQPIQNGTRTQYVHKYNPGSVVHTPNGTTYHPSPLAAQGVAASIVAIEQAVLRIIGSNWCMPEFMISGDASNNNYASILVAGSPFIKYVEALQGDCAEEDEELLWKVLHLAWQTGHFANGYEWPDVKAGLEIKVEAPQASIEDKEKEANVNAILSDRGLLSDRTWATRANLDYEQERANGARAGMAQPEPITPSSGTPDVPASTAPTQAEPSKPEIDASQGLNGAQISSALELMVQVSAGTIASEVALELLVGIGIDRDRAGRMLQAQSKINVSPAPVGPPQAKPTEPSKRLAEAARLLWRQYPHA